MGMGRGAGRAAYSGFEQRLARLPQGLPSLPSLPDLRVYRPASFETLETLETWKTWETPLCRLPEVFKFGREAAFHLFLMEGVDWALPQTTDVERLIAEGLR